MAIKTRAQLNAAADANLADNSTGDISAGDVRAIVKDIADSAVMPEDGVYGVVGWAKAASAGQTGVNLTTKTALALANELYDVGGFWDSGANTRLTVPAGLGGKLAHLKANVQLNLVTSGVYVIVNIDRYNSSGVFQAQVARSGYIATSLTAAYHSVSGDDIPAAGDYYVLYVEVQTDTSITIVASGNATYMSITMFNTPV